MNRFLLITISLITLASVVSNPVHASEVTIPNTFSTGTPAVAAEVNANFTAAKTAVDDNHSRIAALETTVAALQATITAQAATIATLQSDLDNVESSQVMALESYVTVDEVSDPRGPLVQLSGINLQIVNGMGGTATINGLGNVIIGYDEINSRVDYYHCSDGAYPYMTGCEDSGALWSHNHKSGSHYLVVGSENNYSQYGGLVAGYQNFVNRAYSTVTGGRQNVASGQYSSVSGGGFSRAGGDDSSVNGGYMNTAAGDSSSIGGGSNNRAGASYSSAIGGFMNVASGPYSSVSGGYSNTAEGNSSSVGGGGNNTSSGGGSIVNGGTHNESSGDESSVSGGRYNIASGSAASVSGGGHNTSSGSGGSVSGGNGREAGGLHDWAAGSLWEDE